MSEKVDDMINKADLPPLKLSGALLKVQKEIKHAELDAENPHFKSKYATLKSVIDTVKGPLNEHGITFYQTSQPAEGGVSVQTTLLHHSGQTLETGYVFVPCDKHNAHGYGSSLTYAKRYSLAMACGISADNDDDANQAVTDLVAYNACVRENWNSIEAIKHYHDEPESAAEAWFELDDQTKATLWLAPTKGGVFTTDERTWIKEDARRIHYGEVKK